MEIEKQFRTAINASVKKHNIIKKLIGYFNTDYKEHAKLDMGYLSIEPEITFSNFEDELVYRNAISDNQLNDLKQKKQNGLD